jgi:deoxyadenosine/deoxycytidine kinase
MNKWALELQIKFLMSRYHQYLEMAKHPLAVIDPSLAEDRFVFASHLYDVGLLNHAQLRLYEQLYNTFTDSLDRVCPEPTLYVYLRATPGLCKERIQMRSRNIESGISIEYLKALHVKYEKLFEDDDDRLLRLDGTMSTSNLAEAIVEKVSISHKH